MTVSGDWTGFRRGYTHVDVFEEELEQLGDIVGGH